ncbi:MAG: GNAT family N-acetyltransferase [Bacteroidia bacterium]|nr:GNAT family N-acetyltransferase [Bacteroidia bacterium]
MCVIKLSGVTDVNAKMLFEIRKKVFVEEQHVPATLEFDKFENEANHYLCFDGDKPCGTARWRITQNGIKLERFAVLPAHRNKGIGAVILNQVLNDIAPLKQKVYLHAQAGAVNFYLKHQFVVDGNCFFEANIPHYVMIHQPIKTI